MARKRKTYKRYSPFAFINGFLCFAIVGLIVAFFFLPVFSFEAGGDVYIYNGKDFVLQCIRKFYSAEPKYDQFVYYFQEYLDIGGENFLLKSICQIHDWLELALVGIFGFVLLFIVIIALMGIFWCATGRLLLPGSSRVISWIIFVFFGLTIAGLIGYLYGYSEVIKGCGASIGFIFSFIPLFILGGIFAISLAMSIIFATSYRHRILYKKPKEAPETKSAPIIEEPKPEPAPIPEPAPEPEPVVEEMDEKEPEELEEPVEEEPVEAMDEEEPPVQEEAPEEKPVNEEWECPNCGAHNKGKFCENCGSSRP